MLERVKDGQVLFTYVPLNTGSIPNAPGASRAALCAGQQGKFWEMHDVLFDWQTRYGNTSFSQNRLLTGVEQLGLSSDAFTNCFNSAGISATLDAAANEGVSTTPTLRVNGVTVVASQAATIPSASTILQAIDDATPADWGQASAQTQLAPPTDDAPTDDATTTATAPTVEAQAPTNAAQPEDSALTATVEPTVSNAASVTE